MAYTSAAGFLSQEPPASPKNDAERYNQDVPNLPEGATAVLGREPTLLAHHEESETVQNAAGKWINVYGRNIKGKAGQQLPGTPEYDTVDAAVTDAKKRSRDEYMKNPTRSKK